MRYAVRPERDRSHWILILALVAFVGFIVYQVGPSIVRHQLTFVAAPRTEVVGTVLDEGRRYTMGRWSGMTEYYPLVRFADGRVVQAEARIPRSEIPPRGQEMTLTCDTATLTRCRLSTFWGVHNHLIGLTLLLFVISAGPLWTVRMIVQDVRRRRAAAAGLHEPHTPFG